MKWAVAVLVLICGQQVALAGRAFPVEAENYATDLFQTINPLLEWDPTNFLIDLSGQYALCKNVDQRGAFEVERNTPEGASIGGLVDSAKGSGTNAEVVIKYIEAALPAWLQDRTFRDQIEEAERFGCSVQPGCKGRAAIACLFSPEYNGGGGGGGGNIQNPPGKQLALAFTPEQYKIAEDLVGVGWDRSHYLENLSGFETDCAMVLRAEWFFAKAKKQAKDDKGMAVQGKFGNAPNLGSTPIALEQILRGWKWLSSKKVGCSIIPDCVIDDQMYVVVSCLFGP